MDGLGCGRQDLDELDGVEKSQLLVRRVVEVNHSVAVQRRQPLARGLVENACHLHARDTARPGETRDRNGATAAGREFKVGARGDQRPEKMAAGVGMQEDAQEG